MHLSNHERFKRTFTIDGRRIDYISLRSAQENGLGEFERLPYSLKVLAENLLRHLGGGQVTLDDVRALGRWTRGGASSKEVNYHPARIIMPDASGIPLLADLSAMRDAMVRLGGDPEQVNPRIPIDFVVDHSIIAQFAARPDALALNRALELERNRERYAFLRWAQQTFENIRLIPPGKGIMHQINLEYLAQVVCHGCSGEETLAHPDCLIGMDSHTPMINALGVFGWGVGGIEAGSAMLGQPISMVIPEVIGCRLVGCPPEGVTATDLVLTVTERLRARGVVQKFVEFCGEGLEHLSLTDRATVANMAPEYGATMGFFPVDRETIAYLRATGRAAEQAVLVEQYARNQGLWHEARSDEPIFSDVVEIDLSELEPSLAGPSRPYQRTPLSAVRESFRAALARRPGADNGADKGADPSTDTDAGSPVPPAVTDALSHGSVAIAAITSCTNTSNPSVLVAAGLLARKARARGLRPKPWVKTSLAPGSRIVADYLAAADLQPDLDALGFHIVGFGCMTCMGASGPLNDGVEDAVAENDLAVAAVLSGNRNFEARIHPSCRMNYLASPPLVVAYALAGHIDLDLVNEPLAHDARGEPVMLAELWPSSAEIQSIIHATVTADRFTAGYEQLFDGGAAWDELPAHRGVTFAWDPASTYLRQPPYFTDTTRDLPPLRDITGARALVFAGDTTTTDHISPVGPIDPESSAGQYLRDAGVEPPDFNNYMTRRGNHEVMIRGTFANIRFRNELAQGREGGHTRYMPEGQLMPIFDAAVRYQQAEVDLVVVAGREYGTGSSRDWAAKGTYLLGVRAVIAESFERIHRSNLIGMGVLPLEFPAGTTRNSLGLDGSETYEVAGLSRTIAPKTTMGLRIDRADGSHQTLNVRCRLDTALEVDYFINGGMLPFALRQAFGTNRAPN